MSARTKEVSVCQLIFNICVVHAAAFINSIQKIYKNQLYG